MWTKKTTQMRQEHGGAMYLCFYFRALKPNSWHCSVVIWVGLRAAVFFLCYQTLAQLQIFLMYLSSSCDRNLFQLLFSYMQSLYLLSPLLRCSMLIKNICQPSLSPARVTTTTLHHTHPPPSPLASSLKSSEGLSLQAQRPVAKII